MYLKYISAIKAKGHLKGMWQKAKVLDLPAFHS